MPPIAECGDAGHCEFHAAGNDRSSPCSEFPREPGQCIGTVDGAPCANLGQEAFAGRCWFHETGKYTT